MNIYEYATSNRKYLDHLKLNRLFDTLKRKQSFKLSLVNGTFTLLTPAHIHLFKEAKKNADKLLVCMNSDISLKNLKPDKIFMNQWERVIMLSGIEYIDYIYLYDSIRVTDILKITPENSVWCKGDTYNVNGRDILDSDEKKAAENNHILTKFIEFPFDMSTSKLISKIRGENEIISN